MSEPQTFLGGRVVLHPGDCRDVLAGLPDASIDSVVTDPPYALVSIGKRFGKPGAAGVTVPAGGSGAYARASSGFMGQAWDTGETAFSLEFWREVLRVLKPGGHVVAFGGTRSYHRLACAIEDAGFEIRDQLAWVYGSGFPKSHDVAKGIQQRRVEDVEPVRAVCRAIRAAMDAAGLKSRHLVDLFNGCHPRLIDHWAARDSDSQPSLPVWEQWQVLRDRLSLGSGLDAEVWRLNGRKGTPGSAWTDAEIVGEKAGNVPGIGGARFSALDATIRAPIEVAAAWQGWGTALKPAWEPIVLARKPLAGTVAETVVQHGTGALNIDGCRVHADDAQGEAYTIKRFKPGATLNETGGSWKPEGDGPLYRGETKPGRWPANIIHDGSDEVVAAFEVYVEGSSRFFYSAKADAEDRIGSKHPTVKPVDLMQWLCRLVTPPGGTVLDPFAGSGSTGEAAWREGFCAVLVEREPAYQADIARRMALAVEGPAIRKAERAKAKAAGKAADHGPLFGGGDGVRGGGRQIYGHFADQDGPSGRSG